MWGRVVYFNTVVDGLIIRQMYEMLRHPLPGALNIIMKKRTIATMTRGKNVTFYYNTCLLTYIFDDYWTCCVLVKIYKNILEGLIHPYLPLNTALINHMADVPNVTAPRAWNADLYDLSRNAYRNNDLRVKKLRPTAAYHAMF